MKITVFGATGGICVIMLCRPGTIRRFNCVSCIGSDAGHVYIAYEYVPGRTMRAVARSPTMRTSFTS